MNGRRVRAVARKEVLQVRRDPLLLRLLLLMPVLQLVLLGYVVAADVRDVPAAVVDLDGSTVSRRIDSAVAASGYLRVVARPAGEDGVRPLLDSGQAAVAVVIPDGTAGRLQRGQTAPLGVIVDGSDATTASVGAGYVGQIVADLNEQRRAAAGLSAAAPGVDARVRVLFNPGLRGVNAMIPALVAVIMMLSLMVIMSQAVVRERESGTLEQMFVTPLRPGEYLLGKVGPYVVLATLQVAIVVAVGALWFRVPFQGSVWVMAAGMALFMVTCIGLGLLVSLVSHTRQQAQQTVMFLMIPAMLLSGFVFPIESMPEPIQPVTALIPLRFAMEIVRGAAIRGAGVGALAVPFAALAVFAVVVFGGALLATRRRLAE